MGREFFGTIKNGRMPPLMREEIAKLIPKLEGKRIKITISVPQKARSDPQNRYYWGVVVPAVTAMFIGHGNVVDEEEVHEFLKVHVGRLTKVITDPDGIKRAVMCTSTQLSTLEWENWMTQIRAWGAQFGLEIPMPQETIWDDDGESEKNT